MKKCIRKYFESAGSLKVSHIYIQKWDVFGSCLNVKQDLKPTIGDMVLF